MIYLELTITTTPEAQELVADKLWEYSSYGVSICDDNDIIELINKRRQTYDYLEDSLTSSVNTTVTLVKCYLDLNVDNSVFVSIENELLTMKERAKGFINFGSLEMVKRQVDGDDWIEIWRKHYRPMDKGKVVICPEWIDYENKENKVVVKIDSNMAFGTGEHETTSMCIEFIGENIKENQVVLDIGTGSGILGITAIKLGASLAYMTDIDEVATITAKRNATLNGVSDKCVITTDNLLDKVDAVADLVVANITADILCILAKDIERYIKENTIIILSGILREKAEEVVETYSKIGIKVIGSKSQGEWVALLLKRV